MLDQVVATEELLDQWLFEKQKAEVLLGSCGGETVGFALFFHNFSTFLGRAGIYLEDLYVCPEYRDRGFGKAFLNQLASIAVERLSLIHILDSIKNGVTTVFDHHASFGEIHDSLFAIEDAAKEMGIRTCLCYEVSDRDGMDKARAAVMENAAWIKQDVYKRQAYIVDVSR